MRRLIRRANDLYTLARMIVGFVLHALGVGVTCDMIALVADYVHREADLDSAWRKALRRGGEESGERRAEIGERREGRGERGEGRRKRGGVKKGL